MSVLLVALCAFLAQCAHSAELPNKWAVDIVTKNGVHVQFPFFGDIREVEPRLREIVAEDLKETLGYTYKNIVDPPRFMSWPKMAIMIYKQEARRNPLSSKLGDRRAPFNEAMRDMFFRMLDKSSLVTKRLKEAKVPFDKAALNIEVKELIDTIEEVIAVSPVATYLDWGNALIDGEHFEDVMSKTMGKLKYHGVGNILDFIGSMMKLLAKLSRSKSG